MSQTIYSQAEEQEVITNYFAGRTGRLLDIGAHDGKQYSNSLALIEAGWGGVLVEPNPASMTKLIALHGKNEKLCLVNASVTVKPYLLLEFWASDSAASTAVEGYKQTWEKKHSLEFAPIMIPPITPETLITVTGVVDFVTIDVEDNNLGLAEAMKGYLSRAQMVCVEHSSCGNTCAPRMREIFEKEIGFTMLLMTAENFIFAR